MKRFWILLLAIILPSFSVLLTSAKSNKELKMNKKILFVVTSHDKKGNTAEPTGFYLSEVTHPHKVLADKGFTIDFVSPKGGKALVDGLDLLDQINKEFMDNKTYAAQIENTKTPEEINPLDYAAIYYAGGHGTMWDFPDNEALADIAAKIYENGGIVGAVCHGPSGLVGIKLSNGDYLVKDKDVSSFTH